MISAEKTETLTLDRLDEQIVRCLQLDPRTPFRRIADVVDVAEQTVNRRYRALVRGGVLRVIAAVDPEAIGESDWLVRIRSRPDAAFDLGRALARRSDIGWVSIGAGGSELVCAVRARNQREREHLLIDRLPRAASVLDVQASVVMRRFVGLSASDWLGVATVLTADQIAAMKPLTRSYAPLPPGAPLGATDAPMLDLLMRDGRTSVTALARAAGISEGKATRRLHALIDSGTLYLDVDLASAVLGFPLSAYVWLTVEPSRLEAACQAMADHEQAPFVAAISGRQNVVASLVLTDLNALYEYVTHRIGALDGVREVEVSPVLRRLKQGGTMMDGERLAVSGA